METTKNYFENYFCEDYNSKRLLSLSDGKLRTEDGGIFLIHKILLARRSKYFLALFCGTGSKTDDALIPGIKEEILSNILSFIYTGNICVTDENVFDLIVSSDYLLLDDLFLLLKANLKGNLTVDNCLPIFMFAQKTKRDDISWESFRFTQMHFQDVVLSRDSGICDLPFEDFKMLLCGRNLYIKSEKIIWVAIVNWVEADSQHRLVHVPDLIMCLAVSDLNETIATEILQHKIIAENPGCQTIFALKSDEDSNLEVLSKYSKIFSSVVLPSYSHRQPAKLHYIAYYNLYNDTEPIQVYLTYDEVTDLWRKVLDINCSPQFLLFVNQRVYLFGVDGFRNFYFDIMEKQWYELEEFTSPRLNFCVVELNGLIYILGGVLEITGDEIYDVDVYDNQEDVWFNTSPMIPISSFLAVTHNTSIYVVGNNFTFMNPEMLSQVYDQDLQTWNIIPSPSIVRCDFGMIVYHDKIYVFGGSNRQGYLKDVEVFDPINKEWSRGVDLPFAYYKARAIVLHDNLIVFDSYQNDRRYWKAYPPVQWNSLTRSWDSLGELSPMNNLHTYDISTIENSECIRNISKQSKELISHFEKCPFA